MELDLLNLALVLMAALAGGRLASRYGYPPVLGEILIGIVLGPPLLGWASETAALQVLAELGVLLMMLYIGMELDPRELGRVSRTGLLAAIGSFVAPAALGWAASVAFGLDPLAALFVALALGATSLATKSRILIDLGILDTRIAHVMVAGSVMSDTLALFAITAVLGVIGAGIAGAGSLVVAVVQVALFFGLAWLIGFGALPALYRWMLRRGATGRTFNVLLVIIVAVLFGELARRAGLHPIIGTFVAGLILREAIASRRLAYELSEVVRDVSLGFLAPIFFVTTGFLVALEVFQTDLGFLLVVIVVATVGRILGTALAYLPSGHGWREGAVVGAGMNGRGAVEIVIAGIGLEAGIISSGVFSILVLMALVTTASAPVLLKLGVGWLVRRDELEHARDRRRGIVIAGAGPLARLFGHQLAGDHQVTLVDRNAANVQEAELEGLHALHGDALEAAVLREAGVLRAQAVLAATPNALVNVLVAQRAREDFVVPDVRAALTHEDQGGLFDVLESFGGRPLFASPVDVAGVDRILAERAMEGRPNGLEIVASEEVDDLEPAGVLPLAVRGREGTTLFDGWQELRPDDRVVVLPRPGPGGSTQMG